MSALANRRVVVTRAPHQAGKLAALLSARGALPLLYPCIDIAPPESTTALDAALREAAAGHFDWLILTSANTALALARRLAALALPMSALSGLSVAAIGPATAQAAKDHLSVDVSLIPSVYVREGLAHAIQPITGARVFLPQSALADDRFAEALRSSGAIVTRVDAYPTVVGSGGVTLPTLLAAGEIDAITLTSGSTAANLIARLDAEGDSRASIADVCIACIGPKTADAARAQGLHVNVLPENHTLEGLIDGLERYFAEKRVAL